MHRSQRTGLAIWPTIRVSTSRPSRTTWPSLLEMTAVRGSCRSRRTSASDRRGGRRRGAMCSVWKAPATLSGISRALAGGSSANASSCSSVPAATIWPGPLSLAGVRPCLSRVASTSSRSPPRTAVMPVGVTATASAIALPRSRTRTIACSAVMAPAAPAARELADAVPGDGADAGKRGRLGEELERRRPARWRRAAAGRSGCRGWCRRRPRCRSGPGRARRRWTASSSRDSNVGSSSQGCEESRRLGALTGSDDDEHVNNSAVSDRSDLASGMRRNSTRLLCRVPTTGSRRLDPTDGPGRGRSRA